MQVFEKIEELLNNFGFSHGFDGSTLTVDAPFDDGFSVSFSLCENGPEPEENTEAVSDSARTIMVTAAPNTTYYKVSFDGWFECIDNEEEALECFQFGLIGPSRLKVHSKGGVDYKWTLQFYDESLWTDVSSVSLVVYPVWEEEKITYRVNTNAG